MNWSEKAAYLARRARYKGGIWLIWLGKIEDNPTRLGSTAEAEDLRDPANTELGWYDADTTKERILADVAKALGSEPSGEANLSRPGRPPGPKANPVLAAGEPEKERAPEPEGETEIPTFTTAPEPEPDPEAEAETEPEPEAVVDHDAGEPDPQPAQAAACAPQGGPAKSEEFVVATLETRAPGLSEQTYREVKARLYKDWVRAHEGGYEEHLLAYDYLIGCLEDTQAGD
ncbi:MAG: hypothetical protein ACLFRB_06685 [Thiohalorhabdus sp.]|uniref:hypothetical protein n=1 Tax=Thiohalorhabdus sp. TaxID=3094134 RepID=UPI00397F34FD